MTPRPWYADSPEFVPEWDVARDDNGNPITITPEQGHAVVRAMRVLAMVEEAEEGHTAAPHYDKSRLLGRMLYEGLPPTRTKPPFNFGAPWWPDLPGGDPFLTEAEKLERVESATARVREMNALLQRAQSDGIEVAKSRALRPE